MRYLSIDLETTGLDSEKNQILEFGAVLEDTNNILPLDQLPSYHAYVTHPGGNITGNVFALNMNAGIIEKLKNQKDLEGQYNFVKVEDLAESFLFWLSQNGFEIKTGDEGKPTQFKYSETLNVAGKNFSSFDKLFLNKVPNFNKFIRIRHRVIDPSPLFVDWKNDDSMPSLDDCKKRAGIDGVVTHLAIDDAKDVIAVLRRHYE